MNGITTFDRSKFLSRSEICDFLTKMTGKVITPELVTAWCKGTMTRQYKAVKHNGVYYLPDCEVVQIMHDIRNGDQLVTISSEKQDVSRIKAKTFWSVKIPERVTKTMFQTGITYIKPMHYSNFMQLVKEGFGDEFFSIGRDAAGTH